MSPFIDPLLIDVPEEITTPRMILRAPRPDDFPEMNRAIHESLEQLQLWMPWATPAPSVDETAQYCRRSAAKFLLREQFDFRMHQQHDGKFVGNISLFNIEWKLPRFEIGYWLRASAAGQGLMTEATIALCAFAMEKLKAVRVEIKTDDENKKSWKVAERAGFDLEGVIRNSERKPDGSLRDTRIYAKVISGKH